MTGSPFLRTTYVPPSLCFVNLDRQLTCIAVLFCKGFAWHLLTEPCLHMQL